MKKPMSKGYALLKLYEEFRTEEKIELVKCCEAYGISVPTFRRYVATLRCFFMETHGVDLIYDYSMAGYRLERPLPFEQ